jgi:hypothetical protein
MGMQRQEKSEKTFASASAVPECDSVSVIDTLLTLSLFPSLVLWNCQMRGFGPPGAGWTFCPARAHPFWIKRGVCPLHDLVSRLGNEDKNDKKNKITFASAIAVYEWDSVSFKMSFW